MQVKQLLTDDDAVSPVIGVILMVAITVILAAVIAAFVLGLGDTSEPAPQVSFDYDYDETDTALDVTVQSGDQFNSDNAAVVVAGTNYDLTEASSISDDTTVSAGDSFTVDSTDFEDVDTGERVDITFTPDEGGESNILGTFTAPE
jgi:flagellin-like protein